MSQFDLFAFSSRLHLKGIETGFDVTYAHGVEMHDVTPSRMGNANFARFLSETRDWCRDSLTGKFTTKRMRFDKLREVGLRFEFEDEIDAIYFALRWC